MKKQTSLLAGSAASFIASISNYAARLGTSVIVARTLGVEGKGIYTLALTVGALLALSSNLGLNGTFAYFTANRRFPARTLAGFAIISSLVLGLACGTIFLLLNGMFLSRNILAGLTRTEILLVTLIFPVNLFTSFLGSILQGKQQLVAYNSIDVVRLYTNLIMQIISAVLGFGVIGALLAWLLSNLAASVLAVWYLRVELSSWTGVDSALLKPAFSYGAKSYVSNMLTFFNYRLDTFFVNYFFGVGSVGQYSTGVGVAELLWYVPNAISSALFPKISSGGAPNPTDLTARICRLTLLVMLPATLLFAGVGIYGIPVLYSTQFQASVAPFLWLLPGIVAVSVTKLISADLSGRGKPQYATYTSALTLAVTLLLDVLLIPRFNIVGAAIASSTAYFASALLSITWFSRETGARWSDVLLVRQADIQFLTHSLPSILHQRIQAWRAAAPK